MRGGIKMSKKQWYAKSTYVLVALALVLSLGVVAVPLRGTVEAVLPAGTHYYVTTTGNDSKSGLDWANAWKTITYAVEVGATNPGDVIHVADGLYDPANGESFPIDFTTNGVSLIGPAGTPIIDAGGAQTNILNIGADGVKISDFELRNAKGCWWGPPFWTGDGKGIYMDDADNCEISNIEIHGITEAVCGGSRETAGIFVDNGSTNNTFSSIEIHHISSCSVARGIWQHDSDGNMFTDINIHDVSVSNSCLSEFAVFGIHLSSSDGNTFDEITIDDITGGDWAEGIELQQSNGNTFGDLSISDVYGEYYAYGIKLGDSCDNTFGSSSEIWNIDAACDCGKGIGVELDPSLGSNRNTFTSFDIHDCCWGFYITGSKNNTLTKSNIHDNVQGVRINTFISEGNKVNCNNIYRNMDYGVYKEHSPDVDATGNWWGDAYGPSFSPGSGDKISTNVLYEPYLSFVFQYCPQCGGSLPPPPAAVPTVNHWGIVAMITLFAGLLVWRVRRRRLAS
jgi:parallel beta-helix repeat protein